MYIIWDGSIGPIDQPTLIPNRLLEEFYYYRKEHEIEVNTDQLFELSNLDPDSELLLCDAINIKKGYLSTNDLRPNSYLHSWIGFFWAARLQDQVQLRNLYHIVTTQAPTILNRATFVADQSIKLTRILSSIQRGLSFSTFTGLTSDFGSSISHTRFNLVKGVEDWILDVNKRTDHDFSKSSAYRFSAELTASLKNLCSDDNARRTLTQTALLMMSAERESENHHTHLVLLCTHRGLELYFSLLLLRSRDALLRRDGKIRYREDLLRNEPLERKRESLINSFHFCTKQRLFDASPADQNLVERINDLRNELTLTHGLSQPSLAEAIDLYSKTKRLIVRIEADDTLFSKCCRGLESGNILNIDLLLNLHPELDLYLSPPRHP